MPAPDHTGTIRGRPDDPRSRGQYTSALRTDAITPIE